jgi:hypothetical protein
MSRAHVGSTVHGIIHRLALRLRVHDRCGRTHREEKNRCSVTQDGPEQKGKKVREQEGKQSTQAVRQSKEEVLR